MNAPEGDGKRGAFDTKASAHPAKADIGKLIDHPYRVFFPDLEMQDEMADRLVELFNNTGLQQISFDGLEGCERTGHGISFFSGHSLRHYFASKKLVDGFSPKQLQEMLGHSNLKTTSIYLHLNPLELQNKFNEIYKGDKSEIF